MKKSEKEGKSGKKKASGRKGSADIMLSQLVLFLRFLGAMAGALFLISLLLFLLTEQTDATQVAYLITLAAAFIAGGGGLLGAALLERKDQELARREKERDAAAR